MAADRRRRCRRRLGRPLAEIPCGRRVRVRARRAPGPGRFPGLAHAAREHARVARSALFRHRGTDAGPADVRARDRPGPGHVAATRLDARLRLALRVRRGPAVARRSPAGAVPPRHAGVSDGHDRRVCGLPAVSDRGPTAGRSARRRVLRLEPAARLLARPAARLFSFTSRRLLFRVGADVLSGASRGRSRRGAVGRAHRRLDAVHEAALRRRRDCRRTRGIRRLCCCSCARIRARPWPRATGAGRLSARWRPSGSSRSWSPASGWRTEMQMVVSLGCRTCSKAEWILRCCGTSALFPRSGGKALEQCCFARQRTGPGLVTVSS